MVFALSPLAKKVLNQALQIWIPRISNIGFSTAGSFGYLLPTSLPVKPANAISLTPIQSGTIALVGTADGGKTLAGWKCGPAATNPLPTKYLPATCKG